MSTTKSPSNQEVACPSTSSMPHRGGVTHPSMEMHSGIQRAAAGTIISLPSLEHKLEEVPIAAMDTKVTFTAFSFVLENPLKSLPKIVSAGGIFSLLSKA